MQVHSTHIKFRQYNKGSLQKVTLMDILGIYTNRVLGPSKKLNDSQKRSVVSKHVGDEGVKMQCHTF